MKLYREEDIEAIGQWATQWDLYELDKVVNSKPPMFKEFIESLTPIELPSDEEIIGRFMNWFLKHYSTATIDGMFGYVNSLEQEVTIREILDHYFNKEQILNQNK